MSLSRWASPLALLLAVLFGAAAPTAQGLPSPAPATDARAEDARAFASALRDSLDLPALAVAVVVDGRLVADEAVGWADVEAEVAVTPATQFRVGSLAKLLTAAAAARLVDRGALDLDARIERLLPDLPPPVRGVTARQLAGHLAGVRHYGSQAEYMNQTPYTRVGESLGRVLSDSLAHAPGTAYLYSSHAYNLLGAVLEGASGQEFRALVWAEVAVPLGLTDTVAEDVTAPSPAAARFYTRSEGALLQIPIDLSDRWPSGGYLSTASDLARLGAGTVAEGYLAPSTRALLRTPQRLADGTPTTVGLGWRVATDAAGRTYLHHGGASLGGRAFLLVYPDAGVSVALATNLSGAAFAEPEALRLAALFLGD